jgi:hypothetical protein
MYDLIVIGGGAAALSATAYALGKQLKVLMVYERLGGKAGQRLGLRPPDADEADYLVGHILVHTVAGEELPVGEAQHWPGSCAPTPRPGCASAWCRCAPAATASRWLRSTAASCTPTP